MKFQCDIHESHKRHMNYYYYYESIGHPKTFRNLENIRSFRFIFTIESMDRPENIFHKIALTWMYPYYDLNEHRTKQIDITIMWLLTTRFQNSE